MELNEDLYLPETNPFIPQDFNMKEYEGKALPVTVNATEGRRIWIICMYKKFWKYPVVVDKRHDSYHRSPLRILITYKVFQQLSFR